MNQSTNQSAAEKRNGANLQLHSPSTCLSTVKDPWADHTATFWRISALAFCFKPYCFLGHAIFFQTHSLDSGSEADAWDVNQLPIQLLRRPPVRYVSSIHYSHGNRSKRQNGINTVNKSLGASSADQT